MEIRCPSGLVFSARPWTLGDHAALLKAKERTMAMLPRVMAELASEAVIDPGPYTHLEVGGKVDWTGISHADLVVANILIRAGRDSHVLVTMPCAACRRLPRDPQDIDLMDIPIFMASEEGCQHLQTGVPAFREVGNIRVGIRALVGRDLLTFSKLQAQEPESMFELQTCLAIAEVNAPGMKKPLTMLPEIRKFWRDQDWSFRDTIESAIDELWGGADLTIKFSCEHIGCGAEQEQSLPLGLSFYGLEDLKRPSKRAKSSTAKSVRELMQQASSPSSSESPTAPASTSPSPKRTASRSG